MLVSMVSLFWVPTPLIRSLKAAVLLVPSRTSATRELPTSLAAEEGGPGARIRRTFNLAEKAVAAGRDRDRHGASGTGVLEWPTASAAPSAVGRAKGDIQAKRNRRLVDPALRPPLGYGIRGPLRLAEPRMKLIELKAGPCSMYGSIRARADQ